MHDSSHVAERPSADDKPRAPRTAPTAEPLIKTSEELPDTVFLALLCAFRASGGMAREPDLLERQPRLQAALRVRWDGSDWLPLFQLMPSTLAERPEVLRVIDELRPALDLGAVIAWFAEPNAWLKGERPVDMLDENLEAVLAAARGDRFVAAGL